MVDSIPAPELNSIIHQDLQFSENPGENINAFFKGWKNEYYYNKKARGNSWYGEGVDAGSSFPEQRKQPQELSFYELIYGDEADRFKRLDDRVAGALRRTPESDNSSLRNALREQGVILDEEEIKATRVRLEEREYFPLIMKINQGDLTSSRNPSLASVPTELRNKKIVVKRLRFWHPDSWRNSGMPQDQLALIEDISKTLTLLKDQLKK